MHAILPKSKIHPVKTEEQVIKDFVINSEMISGVGFKTDDDEKSAHVARHRSLAKDLFNAHQYANLALINATLSNRQKRWYRTGVDALSRGIVPAEEDVTRFIANVDKRVQRGIERLKDASPEDKSAFAWDIHDRVISIRGFRGFNDRTARIHMNHVRVLLGLNVLVIRNDNSEDYYARVHEYRQKKFLPRLKRYYRRFSKK